MTSTRNLFDIQCTFSLKRRNEYICYKFYKLCVKHNKLLWKMPTSPKRVRCSLDTLHLFSFCSLRQPLRWTLFKMQAISSGKAQERRFDCSIVGRICDSNAIKKTCQRHPLGMLVLGGFNRKRCFKEKANSKVCILSAS